MTTSYGVKTFKAFYCHLFIHIWIYAFALHLLKNATFYIGIRSIINYNWFLIILKLFKITTGCNHHDQKVYARDYFGNLTFSNFKMQRISIVGPTAFLKKSVDFMAKIFGFRNTKKSEDSGVPNC